jgi:hypothetical protein
MIDGPVEDCAEYASPSRIGRRDLRAESCDPNYAESALAGNRRLKATSRLRPPTGAYLRGLRDGALIGVMIYTSAVCMDGHRGSAKAT